MSNILRFNKYRLNEYTNANDLTFVTPIKDVHEYFLNGSEFALKNDYPLTKDSNYNIDDFNFNVIWELNIDARNYGIKDISVNIKKVVGTFTLILWDDDTELNVDFNPEELGFKIINDIKISNSAIAPSSIEINFKDKTVTVTNE